MRSCGWSVGERIWFSARFSAHSESDEQRVGGWRHRETMNLRRLWGLFFLVGCC